MKDIVCYSDEDLKFFISQGVTFSGLKRLIGVAVAICANNIQSYQEIITSSTKSIHSWVKNFFQHGIVGLIDKQRQGRPSRFSDDEILLLKEAIEIKNHQDSEDKVVHAEDLNKIIEDLKIKPYSKSGIYKFAEKNGIRKVKPRPVHIKNDPEIMISWENEFEKDIEKIKEEKKEEEVLVYFQDESRFGQKTISTGIWHLAGSRPEYKNENGFLNTWIFGAINIDTGDRFGLILPTLNSDNMQIFIDGFSKRLEKNRHAIMVLDGSRAHKNNKIIVPKNITLYFLPPYSPQLNPIEQIWLYLKKRYLSFKKYSLYEDLCAAGSTAWNKLSDEIIKNLRK
jgi:transposase